MSCTEDSQTAGQPDLAGIRRRLAAATPGPWSHHGADVRAPDGLILTGRDGTSELRRQADRDAEFVANARQDLAALLAMVADCAPPRGTTEAKHRRSD